MVFFFFFRGGWLDDDDSEIEPVTLSVEQIRSFPGERLSPVDWMKTMGEE